MSRGRSQRPLVTRWTHAYRRPGPMPDRCTVDDCGCNCPERLARLVHLEDPDVCVSCGHEVLPAFSLHHSTTSPEPPR